MDGKCDVCGEPATITVRVTEVLPILATEEGLDDRLKEIAALIKSGQDVTAGGYKFAGTHIRELCEKHRNQTVI